MASAPAKDTYYLLVFYITTKDSRPIVEKDCRPYSLQNGKLEIKSVVADYTNKGLYCTQNGTHQSYTCNNTFKTVRVVLVQGKNECHKIPDDMAIKERRML